MEKEELANAIQDFDNFLKKISIVEMASKEQLSSIINANGFFKEICQVFLLFQIENLLNIYFLFKLNFPSEFSEEKRIKLLKIVKKTETLLKKTQNPKLKSWGFL